jgi:CO/xanthine dehydrogenase Mo-binding subunit
LRYVAARLPAENIHIRSPFLGGRFGSKGLSAGRQILGILTARLVGRPVKHTDDGAVVSRVVTDGASYQVGFDADGDATISAAF